MYQKEWHKEREAGDQKEILNTRECTGGEMVVRESKAKHIRIRSNKK